MDSEDETEEAEPPPPKPKRKKRRTDAHDPEERVEPSVAGRWTTAQVVMILAIGLGVGAFGGYQLRGRGTDATKAAEAMPAAPAPEQLGPLAEPSPPAAGADKFGRSPGDEHFGHDHPPQGAAAPAGPVPSGTGVDSFGRAPGSEHYGHNHQ